MQVFLLHLTGQHCKVAIIFVVTQTERLAFGFGASQPRCTQALLRQALCAPYRIMGALNLTYSSRWPPKPKLLISFGSKKKEPRYVCLSEARASHSHRMSAEVSSPTPHFLHKGLSSNPSFVSHKTPKYPRRRTRQLECEV